MRRFFLLLVFCNIVYFLWAATVNNEAVSTSPQVPLYDQKTVETLQLVPADREDFTDLTLQQGLIISEPAEDNEPAKEQHCILLGDFIDKNKAQGLAEQLVNDNARVSVISPDTYEEYWVMFPAATTWQESLKNEQMVKEHGEDDLWLIPSGENKGVISLGLFVDVKRANNRLNELLAKEIDATIEVRAKPLFAVKVEMEAEQAALPVYLEQLDQIKTLVITKNSC